MKAKVQKEREKRDVVWRVEEWKDRKLVSVEDVVETEEDGEDDDTEWDEEEQVKLSSTLLWKALKTECFYANIVHFWSHYRCACHGTSMWWRDYKVICK